MEQTGHSAIAGSMSADGVHSLVAILGGGVMGSGIATLALGHGLPVTLVDIGDDVLDRSRRVIGSQLRHAQLMSALPAGVTVGDLTTSTSIRDTAGATIVIEAVSELPELKAKVLTEVSDAVRPGTPLISNTSGIPIDEMAAWVARPDELIGTHFMNPPYLISMVEVIEGPRTGAGTMTAVTAFLASIGRQPIVVRDSPGFVTSRLLHPMINQATALVGRGIVSVEAVDALMEGCLGHRVGPLRTADLIGIDNLVDSLNALYERTGEESCRPAELMLEKIRAGHLGRKSGRGFYEYQMTS
jgi:methoxymalonate biosynthesis protein